MELDIADGKIIHIDTINGSFDIAGYDLGTTTKGNFFAAVGRKDTPEKGTLVLIPVSAVTAIHMEVEHVEQQDASEDKA